jgi:prolyl 4-hydroxylase
MSWSRSDVEDGGETVFPKATPKGGSLLGGHAKRGVSVKPEMGDALLFWSMRPDGSHDPKSLNGGIVKNMTPLGHCFVILVIE